MSIEDKLWKASSKGDLSLVKNLIEEYGANIHYDDEYALQWASFNGHLEVVKYLVKKGANIHTRNDRCLMCASDNGHLEIVDYFKNLIRKEKINRIL